jgi:DNA-binding XRE family transcriptional regulator
MTNKLQKSSESVTNKNKLAERLQEERKRLGFTQDVVSQFCDVKRETWARYEAGLMSPGSEVLSAFAKVGGDVLYVLTSMRNENVAIGVLEQNILYWLRKMNGQSQATLYHMAHYLSGELPRHELPASFQEK